MNKNFPNKKSRYEIPTLGIRDVDQAVYDYFDKKLHLTVDDGSKNRKSVPIMFATGERWKLIREKKAIRDDNKTLILPLITIQRMDIDRTPGFNSFGQEVPQITLSSLVSPKNKDFQYALQQRKVGGFPEIQKDKVVREYLSIPTPDYATVYYQILFWCQHMGQMNDLLERVFHAYEYKDQFVLPVKYDGKKPIGNGYYFVGFREGNISSQSNFEEFTDQERIIRYTYNIKVSAFFILDPKDTPLAYGKNIDDVASDGKFNVYKTENSVEIKFKEKVKSLRDFNKDKG